MKYLLRGSRAVAQCCACFGLPLARLRVPYHVRLRCLSAPKCTHGRFVVPPEVFHVLLLMWAALAVVVYLRFLVTLVPLFQRLGPMINTVGHGSVWSSV